MLDFLSRLFDSNGFPPRWSCGTWTDAHGWLHILSDLGIWSAYLAIPCVLASFILRRKDIPFRTIFLLFGAFILACGTTHLMEAIIFWWPAYRLAGVIKLFTALISWATVIALIPVVPKVLSMRSPEELEREVAARKLAEDALQKANVELEDRVRKRTVELAQANEALVVANRGKDELLAGMRKSEQTFKFLAEASAALVALVDYESTLQIVARQSVPFFADWCAVDMLDAAGTLRRVAVAHVDPAKVRMAQEIRDRVPPDPSAASGVWNILRTGRSEFVANFTDEDLTKAVKDPESLKMARAIGVKSYIGVPLKARGKTIGAVIFVVAESGRRYDPNDLAVAEDLASRVTVAIENARLYRESIEADRRKDVFLATLAHELRNPLAPIKNAVHIMKNPALDAAKLQWARGVVERQVNQMSRLVDDLLDISRISRGKVSLRKSVVDLAAIVEGAVETSRPLLDERQLELSVALPAEPVQLEVDATRLEQVIANLLNNSSKYTEPGGRVFITAERNGTTVEIRVRDTGIGIGPETLPHVFEMFVQGDHAKDRAQGGLGIGLSLVQSLVQMHGGSVSARSDGPGAGSEFCIRLPISKTAGDAGRDEQALPPARRNVGRILVVDDNVDSADSLALMLRLAGHVVDIAHDGKSALAAVDAHHPDMIFLDIGLPGMDGYEVARQIRRSPNGEQIVLLALTGWGQEEDRRRSKEAGFDQHLVKPIDTAVLRSLIGESTAAKE